MKTGLLLALATVCCVAESHNNYRNSAYFRPSHPTKSSWRVYYKMPSRSNSYSYSSPPVISSTNHATLPRYYARNQAPSAPLTRQRSTLMPRRQRVKYCMKHGRHYRCCYYTTHHRPTKTSSNSGKIKPSMRAMPSLFKPKYNIKYGKFRPIAPKVQPQNDAIENTIDNQKFNKYGKFRPVAPEVLPQNDVIENTIDSGPPSFDTNEDNLVLDFSNDEGPTFVKSTVVSPEVLDTEAVFELGTGDFSILLNLVNKTDLGKNLKPGTSLTVFAPTNKAFIEAFPPSSRSLESLPPAQVAEIVARHVIFGLVKSQVLARDKVFSATNEEIGFIRDSQTGQLSILDSRGNPVKILRTDIEVPFGIVHVIESVLE